MSRRRIPFPGLATLLGAFLALMLAACLPTRAHAQAAAPLTNDDVIKMVQAKLPDAVIVAKIKSSPCKFDTSTDALIKLKQAGISDAVMQAMAEAGAPAAGPPPPPDPNDPNAEHDPGIYYVRQNPGGHRMTQLDPTAYSGGKSGGVSKSAMTYGISKSKWKAVVRGARATTRITEAKPTFFFYFEQKKGSLSYSASWAMWFSGASTPNQFTLARFDSKKDERELIVGEFGATGSSMGTRGKDVVEFDYTKAAPGIYKVTPRVDMEPGEYCFFYTGTNTAMGMGGGQLFDFGINPAE